MPFGISKPQNVGWATFVVVVGEVRTNPLTVTGLAVSAVLVPGYVKVDVEYACELVAITFTPFVSVAAADN